MLTDRQRAEHRAWQREWESFERAEREAAERPLREAEAALTETYRKLHSHERQAAADERGDHAYWVVPEEVADLVLDRSLARAVNKDEFRRFVEATPDFAQYDSDANRQAIGDYLLRQKSEVACTESYKRAFNRLRETGLIQEIPPPVVINLNVEPAERDEEENPAVQPEPEFYEGIDPKTGRPRTYTRREVDKMDSTTYRKVFRLYGDNTPRFIDPRMGTRKASIV